MQGEELDEDSFNIFINEFFAFISESIYRYTRNYKALNFIALAIFFLNMISYSENLFMLQENSRGGDVFNKINKYCKRIHNSHGKYYNKLLYLLAKTNFLRHFQNDYNEKLPIYIYFLL